MRQLILSLMLLVCTFLSLPAQGFERPDPRRMSFPPLTYEIPKAERIVLDCGMPVYLLPDNELPLISLTAMVRTGSVYEPAKLAGLAAMTGSVMRSGGAGGVPPEKMDDELEFMASAIESAIGRDMGSVSLSTLKRNFPRTLQIFTDVLLRPDFSEKRVEIARRQMIEGLRRQNDDPKEIAGRELGRAIYKGHPLGTVPDFASATAISRAEMISFHRRFYRVDNMILAVSGDFERNEMIRRLNETFKRPLKAEALRLPEVAQPELSFRPAVIFGKKASGQSVIRLGHLGVTKDNPDLYAIRVLDYILGGSFTSRLMMEIRTNQGLAYNVGSHFDVGRRFTGSFVAETETKPETTVRVIGMMREIIAGMTRGEVSDQELATAKESIVNSFMFGFTSPAAIVNQRARLEFYGYPGDYLDRYRERIGAITKRNVLEAARKYLKPDAFKIVVVGDPSRFDKPLESIGSVETLDLGVERGGRKN